MQSHSNRCVDPDFGIKVFKSILFMQVDDTMEFLKRSGKPGYLHGEPVLGGSLKEKYPSFLP